MWVPFKNQYARFLLPSTNLAREWLQIDTYLLRIITSTADELSRGTNINDLERPWTPKIGVLVIFFRDLMLPYTFQVWTAPKSLETDQDNLPMKFSALNIDFNSASFGHLGSRSPPYECIKFGYPLQNTRFMLKLDQTSKRTVADRHRLAAYHNKHCWRAFRAYQHRWPWTTLNLKNRGFQWIFHYFRLRCTLQEWIFTEITGDRLIRQLAHEIKVNWCCRASHEQ